MGQFGDSIFDSNTDCNTLHDLETAVPPGEGNELLINQKSLLVVQKKASLYYVKLFFMKQYTIHLWQFDMEPILSFFCEKWNKRLKSSK